MLRYKIFILLFLIYEPYAVSQIKQPFTVEKFCSTYTGQSDFLKDMSEKILKNSNQRVELVKLMKSKKAQGCRNALSDYLNQFIKKDLSIDGTRGFESYLLLSFAANLSEATQIIEKEIDKGRLIDWLDIFQNSNKEAYYQALSRWVTKVANLVRELDKADLVDEKFYGKITDIDKEIKTPESIPIWNPLLINKYMSEVVSEKLKLSKNEFANLNIIYAASNQSYRDVFLAKMSTVVSLSVPNWIASFRVEPAWVQFRLFPIMGKVGGGIVKRELIWLSNYHQNFKIRSVAQSTLDRVNLR